MTEERMLKALAGATTNPHPEECECRDCLLAELLAAQADVRFMLMAHHAERTGRIGGNMLAPHELDAIRSAVDAMFTRYQKHFRMSHK